MRPAESAQNEALMARRRYQNAEPKLLPSGRWQLRWRKDVIKQDGSWGRSQEKTCIGTIDDLPTKKLAKRAAVEFLETVNSRDYRPGKVVELQDFAKMW